MTAQPVMNFFENQDQARRNTTRLVFLFALAVFLIIVAIYCVVQVFVLVTPLARSDASQPFHWFDPKIFAIVALAVVLFVGIASLYKTLSLRQGGTSVAVMLGGTPVAPGTNDPAERRLLNVVEEMAIASGVSVPRVFVLNNEEGINAFAAGFSADDAAVTVTRGALKLLNRDQLQGVIAHEFSHILNGDMRLNIRLIGILFGILVISLIGRIMMRVRVSSRSKGAGGIVLAGLALTLIGYIGVFIGRIIQAAVSRQREFLADSSAVQFTRNPDGIAGALKRIGGFARGSRIESPHAEQLSHMFFGEGIKSAFGSLMATHPPLAERIARIEPEFDGDFPKTQVESAPLADARAVGFADSAETVSPEFAATVVAPKRVRPFDATVIAARPETVVGLVGNPSAKHLDYGVALLALIPATVKETAKSPLGAAHIVHALLLDRDDAERQRQLTTLRTEMPEEEIADVLRIFTETEKLDARARLPLLDIALPALRLLTPDAVGALMQRVENLIASDGKVTLFEFSLQWILDRRLVRSKGRPTRTTYTAISPLAADIVHLLGAIAMRGNPADKDAARTAFDAGAARIPDLPAKSQTFSFDEPVNFGKMAAALERIGQASFPIKQYVIDAAAHCAFADRVVTVSEAELLRVVSVSFDCPLPPFLPEAGQV